MKMEITHYRICMKDGSTTAWLPYRGKLLNVDIPECAPHKVERIEWSVRVVTEHAWLEGGEFTVTTPVKLKMKTYDPVTYEKDRPQQPPFREWADEHDHGPAGGKGD